MDDLPTSKCPRCGIITEDQDGLGFLYCEFCGNCTHPSLTDDKCDLCGDAAIEKG